jgi:hypothetical protein
MPLLEGGELLAEHKVIQVNIPTATKMTRERAEPDQEPVEHPSEL